jgi:hypothetical protein
MGERGERAGGWRDSGIKERRATGDGRRATGGGARGLEGDRRRNK